MPLDSISFSPTTTIASADVNTNFANIDNLINAQRPTMYVPLTGIIFVALLVATPIRISQEFTLVSVSLDITTAPTGADLIVDINKGGSSIFTTRPQINAGETQGGSGAVFNTTTLSAGDIITHDIDQVGATVNGSDLTIGLVMRI